MTRPRRLALLWLLTAAAVSLRFTIQGFRDPDVWWHLALGRIILAHGVPAHEPFSFSAGTGPWVDQQWLYEAFLARLVDIGGPNLASVVMGVVASGALLIAALVVPLRDAVGGAWRGAALVIASLIAGTVLGVRGQVMSVLGTALVLLILAAWRRRPTTRAVWWLPPLLLVWCNTHAGFIVGLVLPLVLVVAGGVGIPSAGRRRLLLATAAAALVTLVNPVGPAIYPYVFQTFSNPTLTQQIIEWSSPNFHDPFMRLLEGETIALVAFWALSAKVDVADIVLAGGALLATLQAQRNMALLALVALPQVTRYGWEARGRIPWTGRTHTRSGDAITGGALMLTAVAALAAVATTLPEADRVEATLYPRAAANYAAAHLLGSRLYSTYEWGGYLAYRFPQSRMVYIYGESAFFGDSRLQRYLDIHLVHANWSSVLEQDGLRHAIVPADSQESSILREIGWRVNCHDVAGASVVLSAPAAGALGTGVVETTAAAPACE